MPKSQHPSISEKDCYEAAIAAFCLVSKADGRLHMAEISRFLTTIKSEKRFPDITPEQLNKDVFALAEFFDRDPNGATEHAISQIKKIKDSQQYSGFVRQVAMNTLTSDGNSLEPEEEALETIIKILGAPKKRPIKPFSE